MRRPRARGKERTRVPRYMAPLFWDADLAALDVHRHRDYIIARVLEYGDVREVRWLRRTYPDAEIVRNPQEDARPLSS